MDKKILKKTITINGAEYTITSEGKVFGKSGNQISIRPNTSGYASFTAGRKGNRTRATVHSLVAKCFLDNPDGLPEIDHLDSDRMNPALENLEWVTRQENVKRAYKRGHHKGRAVGEKNSRAVLTEETVTNMRYDYYINGIPITFISDKYGAAWSTVSNAVKGITWMHLPFPEGIDPKKEA